MKAYGKKAGVSKGSTGMIKSPATPIKKMRGK